MRMHLQKIPLMRELEWDSALTGSSPEITELDGGFHGHGGTPIAGWFVKEHPIQMDDLGIPLFFGETSPNGG